MQHPGRQHGPLRCWRLGGWFGALQGACPLHALQTAAHSPPQDACVRGMPDSWPRLRVQSEENKLEHTSSKPMPYVCKSMPTMTHKPDPDVCINQDAYPLPFLVFPVRRSGTCSMRSPSHPGAA